MASHPEYTGKKVDAGGFFDDLMEALKSHLEQEYAKQRIRGADYTKVYLGSVEAALANATQYLTAMELMDVQRLKIEAEILAINAEREKTELEKERLRYEIDELLPLEKIKTEQQGLLIKAQVEEIRYKIDELYPLEKVKLELQNKQIDSQVKLTDAQIDKMKEDIELVREQVLASKFNREKVLPVELLKVTAEKDLINQRFITEVAQTENKLPDGSAVAGSIGKQIELHEQQRISFIRDAEHKVGKMMTEIWSISKTADEDHPLFLGGQNRDISRVVQKVVEEGIGLRLDIADETEKDAGP
jgi:hypothetical protein